MENYIECVVSTHLFFYMQDKHVAFGRVQAGEKNSSKRNVMSITEKLGVLEVHDKLSQISQCESVRALNIAQSLFCQLPKKCGNLEESK